MKQIQKASVCGLGKLGACIAATLAARGVEVVGVDIDAEKVRKVNDGLAPVEEPHLPETIREAGGRLRATQDYRQAVGTDVSFFIPPSPSLPDGSFSNEYLLRAMQPVAAAVREQGKKGHLFVCSSTTTPGAGDQVLIPMLEREIGGVCGRDFGYCYNPEFIALGNVINGLLEPDLVLIGESDPESGAALEQLYQRYNRNSPRIARMSVMLQRWVYPRRWCFLKRWIPIGGPPAALGRPPIPWRAALTACAPLKTGACGGRLSSPAGFRSCVSRVARLPFPPFVPFRPVSPPFEPPFRPRFLIDGWGPLRILPVLFHKARIEG